jgi:8-oxo-dGTP pyrophosphatase MutT (NUDIX family)
MKNNKTDIDVIEAAGGLIWRNASEGKELAIIHRPKHDDWTLPKGKLEPGESWKEAALREAQEETGCQVEIANFAGCICYTPLDKPKVVLYWNMNLIGECHFQPNKEVDQLRWVKFEEALAMLDYQSEKELILKNNLKKRRY